MTTQQKSLSEWLTDLEDGVFGGKIDLGLERITKVKNTMALNPACPVISVGGTNGKGSVCAFLTAIYREAGYKVGTLTSPHLLRFNERIAINGKPVDDNTIIQAFEKIEQSRGSTALSYFEFNALAAVLIFIEEQVDVMILEVGLGGRLDATNAWDSDVAAVVSVDLDHQHFLGDTVEQVAFEKAGIFRADKPAICGQNPPPKSMIDYAQKIGTHLLSFKSDFNIAYKDEKQWNFQFQPQNNVSGSLNAKKRNALPIPALRGDYQLNNAAVSLAVIECLFHRLPVDNGAIRQGLLLAENAGRFQVLAGRPIRVLDVGHNPHAARALKKNLRKLPFAQRKIAVFSMLADKDMNQVIDILKEEFDEWYIAPLDLPRGRTAENIQAALIGAGISADKITIFNNIKKAWETALNNAGENDRIVVFGSFHTVAEVYSQTTSKH
ncbi:MAG: bifunctional tetrahydrofolate synthase/dihydrofolate synthase [Neisseriaceae bacterium]|nr:bifunctional tetrahydrofolate synthase/dihydrofolate synthase [Neisseriaceae bacterium]